MHLYTKLSAAFMLAVASNGALAVESASFDPNTNTLTLPFVKLDGSSRYKDIVIKLQSLGQLQLDDASVSDAIEFVSSGNILRLPRVVVGGTTYSRISLTNPSFSIQSVGGLVTVDAGTSGNYTLDITVSASGMSFPAITVTNVPKPATESEFCGDASLKDKITQSAQGFSGSWTMNSCSFNGTTGTISMTLATSFITLPYSAQYTYR